MSKEKNKHNHDLTYIGIAVGIVVFAAWLISYWIYSVRPADYATLGDSFGALNALFSGLAFAGLIYAIRLQSLELRETRDELEKTREAQEEQAKNQTLSAKLQALNTLTQQANQSNNFLYNHLLEKTLIDLYGPDPDTGTSSYLDKLYENVFAAQAEMMNTGNYEIFEMFAPPYMRRKGEDMKNKYVAELAQTHRVNKHFLINFLDKEHQFKDSNMSGELQKSLTSYLAKNLKNTA